MVKYKMVLFDSDGTLADTLPWASAAFNQLADKYGFKPITAAEHDELRHLSMQAYHCAHIYLWFLA